MSTSRTTKAQAADQVPDHEARRRITQCTDETLFVAAGAGAGKTTALVDRILTLVLRDGVRIDAIAAVTFTDRAAEDLRAKVRVKLESQVLGTDADRARRAETALAGLDLAAIGTLHAFAQRILAQHAIEAGIPPAVEVGDQMSSAIAAQQRWGRLRAEMLQDPDAWTLYEAALDLGLSEKHLRALVGRLEADADLIPERILRDAPRTPLPELPLLAPLVGGVREIAAQLPECRDGGDPLAERIRALQEWADACPPRPEDGSTALGPVLTWLGNRPSTAVGNKGSKARWSAAVSLPALRAEIAALGQEAEAMVIELRDGVLRRLLAWFGTRVLADAQERRRSGRLEFHDLLVGARDLLRRSPAARAALHERYPVLLLDEFQDTDPLQIEIAARIAGGAAADAPDWRDIRIPEGSLFVVGDPKQSIYRFRRADIGLYLSAREVIGQSISLTTNFRSGPGIIAWINGVFSEVITQAEGRQPTYEPLAPFRAGVDPREGGPAVAILGDQPHPLVAGKAPRSEDIRRAESAEIAAVIRRALAEGWIVTERVRRPDGTEQEVPRPLALGDITLLVPTRTSLGALEGALDAAGIGYRTEAGSLVLADPDVLTLRAAARALADPSDQLALVTALRAPQFGCGDDDLWTWVRDGGSFDLRRPVPEHLAEHPVARATAGLRDLQREVFRCAPSEVLERIIRERRMLEVAATGPRAREGIRRLRYVVEQARAWSDVEHDGLRSFLDWLDDQAEGSPQSAESVLPETDTDGVRITTIHAAKGLDFPMVIVAGLGGAPTGPQDARILWGEDPAAPVEIAVTQDLTTRGGRAADAREREIATAERARLLYVAMTRARDHLVLSLHRPARKGTAAPNPATRSSAQWLVEAGALDHGAVLLEVDPSAAPAAVPEGARNRPVPLPRAVWEERIRAAQERSRVPWSTSASMLEGAEAEPTPADPAPAEPVPDPADPVLERAGDPQSIPPGSGAAIGTAVHGVLQVTDLATSEPEAAVVRAQCAACGVPEHEAHVAALVRAALAHPLLSAAASAPRHWRELYLGLPAGRDPEGAGHRVRDGIIDLLIEEPDGSLTLVDYKTDHVPVAALGARTAFYAPQLREYRRILEQVTGRSVGRAVLLFLAADGARAREVPA